MKTLGNFLLVCMGIMFLISLISFPLSALAAIFAPASSLSAAAFEAGVVFACFWIPGFVIVSCIEEAKKC